MPCLSKISNIYPTLTETEKRIANFISANVSVTLAESIHVLAEKTETSPATWVRFSKKLGYSGLTAMKVDLSKDELNLTQSWTGVINEEDSFEEIFNKSKKSLVNELNDTLEIVSFDSIIEAINILKKARRIYLFGVGGSGVACYDLVFKLVRIDLNAIYQQEAHLLMSQMAHVGPEDAVILISYSGQTKMVNKVAEVAKQKGATIISITQFNPNTPLAKLTDIPLYIPIVESPLRIGAIASRNSTLIVTDFLYLGLAKNNFEKTNEALIKTRKFVEDVTE